MSASLAQLHPVLQALLAGCFTWGVTAAGAGLVFFFRSMRRGVVDAMMGFAAGVMIAASVWSLLLPSIELAEAQQIAGWIPAAVGFLLGGFALRVADHFLPHLHLDRDVPEGMKTSWRRTTLLVLAITLHNLPEGLAVGVAFGAVAHGLDTGGATSLASAMTLALGIGLQNFPEGLSVAMPLRGEGLSRLRSFWYGQLSGAVEPVAAVVGAAAVMGVRPLLPYALSFAAGAMIFVVVEELIPESQAHGNTDLATLGAMLGFTVMMVLDVALG